MKSANGRSRGARVVLVAGWAIVGGAPGAAADTVGAVATPGAGTLTICRNWLVYDSCGAHRVALPKRIAVGDRLRLTFGSNAKQYTFRVGEVRLHGDGCTLLSETNAVETGERIDVAMCQAATNPAADNRLP